VLLAQAILKLLNRTPRRVPPIHHHPGRVEKGVDFVREEHWAFNPRASGDSHRENRAWLRNPIDAFVLAGLEQQNLAPSAEAGPRDSDSPAESRPVGLPPAPSELNRFVNDRDPAAYESLVARLLASPHFGRALGAALARSARSRQRRLRDDKLRPTPGATATG